jgi:8-amino-7-oxononanoate synthase
VPQRGDTIIYDFLSHASLRDGIRLSFAQSFAFRHNDLADLEKRLQTATGTIFVVTESVFSMDGDTAPLTAISDLCEQYGAHLIVDEAHATGVVGLKGEGLVQHLQLQTKCFARIHTFGKAVGCHGAIILGSERLRNYLVNFCRSFIYSTSLPEASVAAIRCAYGLFPGMHAERAHLQQLIKTFQQAPVGSDLEKLVSDTPIQIVIIPGNDRVKKVASALQAAGLDVRAILYPTVPAGKERLRIVLHAFNSMQELQQVIEGLKT